MGTASLASPARVTHCRRGKARHGDGMPGPQAARWPHGEHANVPFGFKACGRSQVAELVQLQLQNVPTPSLAQAKQPVKR
jgi:hypothetical protein